MAKEHGQTNVAVLDKGWLGRGNTARNTTIMVLTNDEEIAKKVDSAVFPGLQGGSLMHAIAAKAVALAIDSHIEKAAS